MSLRIAPHVTVVDLSAGVDRLVERGFSELQRGQLPMVREGLVDASRVLVVGSEGDVRRSHKLMEEILVDQAVRSTLCVVFSTARGAAAEDGPVELPLAFEGEKVGVIWVGDARGVLWQPGSAKTRALTVSQGDPDGDSALAALADALRAPMVFDAAFAATSLASSASSPGLRFLVPDSAMSLLGPGERAAVEEVTGASNSQLAARIDIPFSERHSDLRFLQGEAPRPAEDDLFASEGAIGARVSAVKGAVAAAERAVQAVLTHPLTCQTTDVLDSVRAVGESLGRLKLYLKRELLEVVDGSDGLDPGELNVLQRAGLQATASPARELNADQSDNQLRELVGAELLQSRSLLAVARELRACSRKATPRSSAETVACLDVACPDELVEGLGGFAPMRLRLDGLGAIVALVVASAAAMCLPPPWMAVPAALLTIAIVALLARANALRRRPSIRAEGKAAAIACVVLGGAAGHVVGSQSSAPALAEGAAAVAAIACLGWAWAIWRESIQHWLRSAALRDSSDAVDAVVVVTANVVMNDWVLANPRLRHARTAARLADSLEQIGRELLGPLAPAGAQPPKANAPHWSAACNPAIRMDLREATDSALLGYTSAVREIIAGDYADLIMQAVEDGWADIVTGLDEDGTEVVAQAFAARLGHYRRDLRDHGLFRSSTRGAGQSVDDEGSPRSELLARIWNDTKGLNDLLLVSVESELVQLCAPQHLLLLDEDPAGARMVRFAPDCVRVKSSATIEKSSRFLAGVIRLVPLRAGTVRFEEPVVRRAAGLSEVVNRGARSSGR